MQNYKNILAKHMLIYKHNFFKKSISEIYMITLIKNHMHIHGY